MDESKDKRKLVFPRCCTLSDDEVAELYNLNALTDEELASVSLERKSLIDDYRLMHELSMLRKQEEERVIAEHAKNEASKSVENNDKMPPGVRKYRFQLLNQLIKKDFELAEFSLYLEKQFHIFTDFHTDPSMLLLPPQEREKRRFWAHCDYLNNLYYNGGSSRAMNITMMALIRYTKCTLPPAAAPKQPSRIPRPSACSSIRFR